MYALPDVDYTLAQILSELENMGSPILCFTYQGILTAIQDTHIDSLEQETSDEFMATKWLFVGMDADRENGVFHAVNSEDVIQHLDIVGEINPYVATANLGWFAIPLGTERLQPYDPLIDEHDKQFGLKYP